MFGRLWEKLKLLWKLAKSERASPREIAWAVGLGAFAGCSPAIGFHGPLAIGLATLARKNRLFAWLGSRISNMLMLPFIALAEVQVAHRLRTGSFVDLTTDNALELAPKLLLDWCLGMFPVGGAIGLVMGFSAYGLARRRDRLRERATALAATAEGAASDPPATTPPKPSGLPPPSSGSRA